jgi:HAD superfamily hydrolase (TIGR01509 family)
MLPRRPKALLFDLDGLLIDSERLARDAIMATAAAMGHDLDAAKFAAMVGVPEDGNRVQLAAWFGRDFSFGDFQNAYRAAMRARLAGRPMPLRPGAAALVADAATLGLPMAVVTSTRRARAQAHLGETGLLGAMALLVSRDDVARPKPDPEPYAAAVSGLGLVADDCLALEDSPTGLAAAAAAGTMAVMVPDLIAPTQREQALALAIAASLEEVRGWLKQAWAHAPSATSGAAGPPGSHGPPS